MSGFTSGNDGRPWTLALASNHAVLSHWSDRSEDKGSVQILLLSLHAGRTFDAAVPASFHLWSWRKIPRRCAVLFQLGFPRELNRECGSFSLFSTSKGAEAKEREAKRGEREKRKWQQWGKKGSMIKEKAKGNQQRNCRGEWEEVYEMDSLNCVELYSS